MPKTDIDYSNTIFYKINCKDETNKALYIGHTTNFVQRKHAHKNSCNNSKTPNHSQKVYQYIRECGGWDNWTMEIIAFHNCENSYEARKIEQEYYEKLGATLNSIQPLPPRKKPKIKTNVHNITKIFDGLSYKYRCEGCDFNCIKKYDYERHLNTRKHKNNKNDIEKRQNEGNNMYVCHCGNIYKYQSGLYRHRKNCNQTLSQESTIKGDTDKNDKYEMIIQMLMKENQDFKQIIIDQNAKILEMLNNK